MLGIPLQPRSEQGVVVGFIHFKQPKASFKTTRYYLTPPYIWIVNYSPTSTSDPPLPKLSVKFLQYMQSGPSASNDLTDAGSTYF